MRLRLLTMKEAFQVIKYLGFSRLKAEVHILSINYPFKIKLILLFFFYIFFAFTHSKKLVLVMMTTNYEIKSKLFLELAFSSKHFWQVMNHLFFCKYYEPSIFPTSLYKNNYMQLSLNHQRDLIDIISQNI